MLHVDERCRATADVSSRDGFAAAAASSFFAPSERSDQRFGITSPRLDSQSLMQQAAAAAGAGAGAAAATAEVLPRIRWIQTKCAAAPARRRTEGRNRL